MSRRILIHAGFYKTGTTSLQKHLANLADTLAPHFTYFGPGQLHQAGATAREFARAPTELRRRAFRRSFRRFAADLPETGNIVVSRENFSGIMPGHRDLAGEIITEINPAARMLARDMLRILQKRFGDSAQIEFLYSLRDRDDWLRSVYGHQLRSTRLREDLIRFSELFPPRFDLQREADKIARALKGVPVHCRRLEDYTGHRHGPAGMVLDLMQVPEELQAALPPAARENTGQDGDLRQQFLKLNRSGLQKDELKRQKAALLRRAGDDVG